MLSKIYNKNLKYKGSKGSFNIRLRVFKDLCLKVGVNPANYSRAFSTILVGKASEFYY